MNNTKKFIDKILNIDITDYKIYLVCNVKGKTTTKNTNYEKLVESEYLSEEEFEEFLYACQDYGLYTVPFFYVEDFISEIKNNPFKVIILETSQRGVGRARDSLIPAICDLHNIIYSGCNAYVNAICSNKYHWTKILEAHNICVPPSFKWLESDKWLIENTLINDPYIIKPIYECASIGITKDSVINNKKEIEYYARKLQKKMHQPLIIQRFIEGYEVEVPVIATKNKCIVLPPVGIKRNNSKKLGKDFLSYDIVYDDNYSFYMFSEVSKKICLQIEKICKHIVNILDLEGYLRMDFRIDSNNNIYIFDINPYPHIVKHSSFSFSFRSMGYCSDQLIIFILKLAKYRFNNQTKSVIR